MMKNISGSVVLLLVFSLFLTSCSAYMYGYTEAAAEDRFILVGDEPEDFGRKRLSYVMGYSAPIRGFVKQHGLPDMTFETKIERRAAIVFYYVETSEVYVFVEENWNPDSRYLLEHRPMTAEEHGVYNELAGMNGGTGSVTGGVSM